MIFNLIIQNSDGTEGLVNAHTATMKEISEWINQAPDFQSRQNRKQIMHGFMYGAGPKKIIELANTEQTNPPLPP